MRFHKQKLAFHKATIAGFQQKLVRSGWTVENHQFVAPVSTLGALCTKLASEGVVRIHTAELNDFLLKKRLTKAAAESGLDIFELESPGFLNSMSDNQTYRASKKRWFMADFYQWQRKRLNILVENNKPDGGQWSFDDENRKKLPRKKLAELPDLPTIRKTTVIKTSMSSVEADFADNPGSLQHWIYPVSHAAAEQWLVRFLEERFEGFGPYEDAIVADQNWLFHSILTPMMNVGLLTPQQVIDQALQAAKIQNIPLNSVEGFIRQIIGWREFMRATYHDLGVTMRTTNYWQHTRTLPQAFYDASTGIEPVDNAIRRVIKTGYCHHIERLMVLGGFMFLCEIHPDQIYTWFMEMFIDSYDWVMVPNVYAMSQHADGGSITTKPYFSGSNYIIKMSHYKKGEWSAIWDALFWRWIFIHKDQLAGNPRWSMMVKNVERMDAEKRRNHLRCAEQYLNSL